MLLDIDRLNDGVAPANGAVDFSMLLSGQLTPTFEVKTGDGDDDVLEFDLSDVFSVDADLYMVSFIFSVMEFILIIMSQQMLTFASSYSTWKEALRWCNLQVSACLYDLSCNTSMTHILTFILITIYKVSRNYDLVALCEIGGPGSPLSVFCDIFQEGKQSSLFRRYLQCNNKILTFLTLPFPPPIVMS